MSQNVFGIQSSLCKTKRTSTLIVLQGLTFEAKGYGYMKANISHNITPIYIFIHIHKTSRDMSLLETADALGTPHLFSSAGNVCKRQMQDQ